MGGADCPRIAPARDSVPHTSTPAPISEWGGEAPSAGSPRFRVRQTDDGVFLSLSLSFFFFGYGRLRFSFLGSVGGQETRASREGTRTRRYPGRVSWRCDALLPSGWAELEEPWNLFDAGKGFPDRTVGSRHPDFIPPTATALKVSITDVEHRNKSQSCGHSKIKHHSEPAPQSFCQYRRRGL